MITDGGNGIDDEPTLAGETPWQPVAQRHYEPDRDGDLTTAIVYAIADAENVDPIEVTAPPLYDCVDVAGIEQAFFGPTAEVAPRGGTGTLEFRYTGYLVTVRSDGWIQVSEPAEHRTA